MNGFFVFIKEEAVVKTMMNYETNQLLELIDEWAKGLSIEDGYV
jgi:hypothetical protein